MDHASLKMFSMQLSYGEKGQYTEPTLFCQGHSTCGQMTLHVAG